MATGGKAGRVFCAAQLPRWVARKRDPSRPSDGPRTPLCKLQEDDKLLQELNLSGTKLLRMKLYMEVGVTQQVAFWRAKLLEVHDEIA